MSGKQTETKKQDAGKSDGNSQKSPQKSLRLEWIEAGTLDENPQKSMRELTDGELDQLVLLLISGTSLEKLKGYCVANFSMTEEEAVAAADQARRRISLAADFTKNEQLGMSINRLESIFSKATAAKDIKTALQAQRELNRLMGLYVSDKTQSTGAGNEELERKLELIESYILPLQLTDITYPIEEHVRIAANILRKEKLIGISNQ